MNKQVKNEIQEAKKEMIDTFMEEMKQIKDMMAKNQQTSS